MVIYGYKCQSCGHIFEDWSRVDDRHIPKPCPECGEDASKIMTGTFGYRIGKEGLLNAAGMKQDGVHGLAKNKRRSVYGPGGHLQRPS